MDSDEKAEKLMQLKSDLSQTLLNALLQVSPDIISTLPGFNVNVVNKLQSLFNGIDILSKNMIATQGSSQDKKLLHLPIQEQNLMVDIFDPSSSTALSLVSIKGVIYFYCNLFFFFSYNGKGVVFI